MLYWNVPQSATCKDNTNSKTNVQRLQNLPQHIILFCGLDISSLFTAAQFSRPPVCNSCAGKCAEVVRLDVAECRLRGVIHNPLPGSFVRQSLNRLSDSSDLVTDCP